MSRLERMADELDAASIAASKPGSPVQLRRASSIRMQPIEWLWPGWLAAGKFHLIGGAPGTGKTTVTMGFTGTVTSGGRWPDGSRAKPGNVIVWTGEDDPADTLVPRLVAAGADLDRVHFVSEWRSGDDVRPFDPATDTVQLATAAAAIGRVSMIILDPVVSAITGDSHKNTEVRRGLQPIVDLGAALGAAVLGITHFSKGTAGRDPTERITGSIAFAAQARVVMITAKRGENESGGSRMLARAKSNIGPDGGGFGYDLEMTAVAGGIEASRIQWGDPLEGTARDLLGDAEAVPESPRDEAAAWLSDLLAMGPVQVKTVRSEAQGAGIAWRTVERAKREVGVRTTRQSIGNEGKGGWVWELSARAPAPPQNVAVLEKVGSVAGSESARSARPPHSERGQLADLPADDAEITQLLKLAGVEQ